MWARRFSDAAIGLSDAGSRLTSIALMRRARGSEILSTRETWIRPLGRLQAYRDPLGVHLGCLRWRLSRRAE